MEQTDPYSPSRLKKYKDCPLAYKLRYIDKAKGRGQSLESFRGRCMHAALEAFHLQHLTGNEFPSWQFLFDAYDIAWESSLPPDLFCAKPGMNIEQYRSAGKVFLRQYYDKNIPMWPAERRTVSVEQDVRFSLTSSTGIEKSIRCIIDRIDKYEESGYWEIVDYKTGAYVPSQKQLDADIQLGLYYWAIEAAYPESKGTPKQLRWKYLAHNRDVFASHTPETAQALADDVVHLIQEIETQTQSLAIFRPKESALCSWCEYAHLCPLKAHGLFVRSLPEEDRAQDEGYRLVENGEFLGWTEPAKDAIREYATTHGISCVEGNGKRARVLESGDIAVDILERPERRC